MPPRVKGYLYSGIRDDFALKLHTFSPSIRLRNAKKTVDFEKSFQSYSGRPRLQRAYVGFEAALYLLVGYSNRRSQNLPISDGHSDVLTEWDGEIAILGVCTKTSELLEKPQHKRGCEGALRT